MRNGAQIGQKQPESPQDNATKVAAQKEPQGATFANAQTWQRQREREPAKTPEDPVLAVGSHAPRQAPTATRLVPLIALPRWRCSAAKQRPKDGHS